MNLRTSALLHAMVVSNVDLKQRLRPEVWEAMTEEEKTTLTAYENAVLNAMDIIIRMVDVIDLASSLIPKDQLDKMAEQYPAEPEIDSTIADEG